MVAGVDGQFVHNHPHPRHESILNLNAGDAGVLGHQNHAADVGLDGEAKSLRQLDGTVITCGL